MDGSRSRIAISYRDYRLNLLAGAEQPLSVNGNYFQVITATGLITLEFDGGLKVDRGQGMGGPAAYTRVSVTSPIDQAVVISLGDTAGLTPYDGRANFTGAVVNVTEQVPNTITPLVDVACNNGAQALLTAVDATMMGLWVTIPIEDTGAALIVSQKGVRIGDSTTAAAKGAIMYPGDTRYFPGTNAFYAFNDLGVNINIALTKQRFV